MVLRQIALNPLIMSTCAGALAAAVHFQSAGSGRPHAAVPAERGRAAAFFVLGVTVALRPFERVPWEVPGVIAVKLVIHPLLSFGLMLLFGPFAHPGRPPPC